MVCLLDWANAYLKYSETKFVKKTFEEKKSVFKRLFKQVPSSNEVDSLTRGKILSFLHDEYLSRSGYAANKDRKNLLAAWNWGMKYMGLPSPNPCDVDRFPEERQKQPEPSVTDFWKVFEKAATDQDKVMLLTYLHLAARRSEIFRLCWRDVDFANSRVKLFTRKRKDGSMEGDWLPMTDDLYSALLQHKQDSDSEWVFPNPKNGIPYFERNRWMPKLCIKAKVKRFGLHAIRHLTASILAQAGVSMIDIQTILRHKNLSTTEKYIRRLDSLRPALRVLPSRKKSHQMEPPIKKGHNLKAVTF